MPGYYEPFRESRWRLAVRSAERPGSFVRYGAVYRGRVAVDEPSALHSPLGGATVVWLLDPAGEAPPEPWRRALLEPVDAA